LLIKRLADCPEITAADNTRLRELLHPDRDPADIRYSLAVARLEPGAKSKPHKLARSEVYYLFRGSGVMHVGDESHPAQAGDAVYIPAGATQWLDNTGPETIEFACIVDPPWTPEAENLVSG
jgi:mannose-6-phosphate isomerase-like protein (cupin superfamily)